MVKLGTIGVKVVIPNINVTGSGTGEAAPIKFNTTAAKRNYTVEDVPELDRLTGKTKDNIDTVFKDALRITEDKYDFTVADGFTFSETDVEQGQSIVINYH